MNQFTLSEDQQLATRLAVEWFHSALYLHKNIFVISGYAGSGKSTVLSYIIMQLNIPQYKIIYAAYTGKAATVLRKKGLNAVTVHRLIYNTSITKEGKPIFRKKKHLGGNIELICIDELSLVPNQIMYDILSYNIPVLALGDEGQLPPIYGENDFIHNPDVSLTTIHRQQKDSGILQLATDIRNGIDFTKKSYPNDVTIIDGSKMLFEDMLNYDQILCSTNKTRIYINNRIRELLGASSSLPMKGEKVICCYNNFRDSYKWEELEVFLVNGLIGYIRSTVYEYDDKTLFFVFEPEGFPKLYIHTYANKKEFIDNYENVGQKAEPVPKEMRYILDSEKQSTHSVNYFTTGYCISCHRAQGSEFPSVLVYDDCFYNDDINYFKWLYTAVTRAQQTLTLARL
jgi:exodeoxyribonuclease-5